MAARSVAFILACWLGITIGIADGRAQDQRALNEAAALLGALPAARNGLALAAEASGEGHWTFVNTSAERFTTASPDELKRVLPTLAPELVKPGARLVLLVTGDTIFRHREHLLALPLARERRTDLMVAINREAYSLVRRGDRSGERLFADIRPNMLVELTERRLFDEVAWQLSHPLKRGSVRVLSLEPGGPASVPSVARTDPQTKRALTDQIAPSALATALSTLSRQTVILTARRDHDRLAFRPSSGPEHTLPIKDVLAAAEAADVNLVLLQSATPRQPGTRGWLWQRISVGRLDSALERDHLADFLGAIASPQSKLLVSVDDIGAGRIRLTAQPMRDESAPRSGIGEALSDLVSNVAGQVVVSGIEASLRDRARQTELDRRLVPGIPSIFQWLYFGLFALGLLGHGIARRWWAGIWQPEHRESYGNAFGYLAARAIRSMSYALLYVPLVAIASVPMALLGLLSRRNGTSPPPASGKVAASPAQPRAPSA